MKRSVVLGGLLVLLLLLWGGLRWKEARWQRWVATASRAELQTYLEGHPDQPEALARLGVLLREAGDRDQAERLLRRSVELAPDAETDWIEYSRAVSDDREAIRILQNMLRIEPDSAPALAEMSRRDLHLGDVENARALAEKAVQLAPESPEAWRSQGEVDLALRRQPDAEKAFRKSLALGDDSETRLSLARTLIPLQRYPEVITLCAPLLRPAPSLAVSKAQRVRALFYTAGARLYRPLTPEEIEDVQSQLREAEKYSADLPPEERFLPSYFLGESFLRRDRPQEAIPYLERSVALGPMFAGSLFSLARAYRLAGEPAKADAASARHARLSRILSELEMFRNRLEQRPEDAETLLRYGGALAESGNTAEAVQVYRRLVSMGKYGEEAQRRLRRLTPH
jgi:tetratricopeptide (TPR) repeat protein